MDSTFARRYRLTKTDEYSSVFGFRRAIRGKVLMLHYLPGQPGAVSARLGIVVGKKQLRRAIDRNRVKRVLREQFRWQRAGLPVFDIVVRLMVKLPRVERRELAEDFLYLLGRLRRPRQENRGTA